MKKVFAAIACLILITIQIAPVAAVEPHEILKNPVLEKRARNISAGLRCLVCQNQSIDDSDAPLARDLRVLVRERLTAGDTDKQAVDYIVDRYGEFVLLQPRFGRHTLILWLSSPLILALALFLIFRRQRRNRRENMGVTPAAEQLTPEEQKALNKILDQG